MIDGYTEGTEVTIANESVEDIIARRKLLPIKTARDGLSSYIAKGWAYLEDLHQRGMPDLDTYNGTVPVGRLGPLMYMGHHDPNYDFEHDFHPNLVIPCYIPKAEYLKILERGRENFDYLSSVFDVTNTAEFDPLDQDLLDPVKILDPEVATREILTWFITNTAVGESMRGTVRAALERSTPIAESLNPDWLLILQFVQNGKLVASLDEVGVRLQNAADYGLQHSNAAQFNVVPFYDTENFVYLLTTDDDYSEVDDHLSAKTVKKIIKVLTKSADLVAGNKIETKAIEETEYDDHEGIKDAVFVANDETFADFDPYEQGVEKMQIVEWLMLEASKQNVSDIHIDVFKGASRIRFSIDGELETMASFPRDYINGISSSIKQLAKVDAGAVEHSEGRFTYVANDKIVDIRLGILIAGSRHNSSPKLVMRLLDRSRGAMDLNELGLEYEDLNILKKAYERRCGLIVVSGGTGHGKSTTLAAILKELNSASRACYTLEDPIEITMDGVTQVTASSKAKDGVKGTGLSFHSGLERLLRMNPDVIVVGEIRDAKTAEVTPKAALTGHLVLSTVHTNDAVTVVSRMLGFGVDPFDLAQSIALASSQVLIRKLCNCSKSAKLKPAQRLLFEKAGVKVEGDYIPIPHGCSACNFRGYRGRRVIMEFLEMSPSIQDAIMEQKTPSEIRKIAVEQGYRTIYQRGLELVMRGETSLEEIQKHVGYT